MAPALTFSVAGAITELEKVPESAASRLNGSEEDARDELKEGGSIRVNGADVRRFLPRRPGALRLVGDRPAGAVEGARGDDMLAREGVDRRAGGGGMDFAAVMVKVKGLDTLSKASLLLFFDGDLRAAGSTFSLSYSSKTAGSKGRLVGEFMVNDMPGLPVETLLLVERPRGVSFLSFCM